jgi:DNA-directed RNA polymerase specialized sigma subunit
MPLTRFDTRSPTGVTTKPPEMYPEYEAWKKKPGPATMTPLVMRLSPTIDSALRGYGLQDDSMMRNAARIHVSEAVQSYDPKKGASLDTFVRTELQRLQRINAQRRSPIPVPEGALTDIKTIDTYEDELDHELGRPPTVFELADRSGISIKRIETLRKKYKPVVTDMSGTHSSDDDSPFLLPAQQFDRDQFAINMAYYDADPIDKKIMEWSLGLYGSKKLNKVQMAKKLGVSVPAISKRAQGIQGRIEEHRKYAVL